MNGIRVQERHFESEETLTGGRIDELGSLAAQLCKRLEQV